MPTITSFSLFFLIVFQKVEVTCSGTCYARMSAKRKTAALISGGEDEVGYEKVGAVFATYNVTLVVTVLQFISSFEVFDDLQPRTQN